MGSVITATYTVQNEGAVSAAGKSKGVARNGVGPTFLYFQRTGIQHHQSKRTNTEASCVLQTRHPRLRHRATPLVDYLLPDSSYTLQHQLTIPYDYFGTQYIYVYTNGYNEAFEGPFSTNIFAVPTPLM